MVKYSVVVPVYNKADYLDECIKSVLDQAYEDMELLLVNDGSKDNSLEICRKYEQMDHRVFVFDKKNSGVSDTRNFGIQKAKGKYIVFLDADDVVAPGLFLCADEHIKDYDILLFESTRKRSLLGKEDKRAKSMTLYTQRSEILKSVVYNQKLIRDCGFNFNRITDYIVSSKLIRDNDVRFDTSLAVGEDKLFNFELFQKTERIACVNQYLYYIRTNGKSVMGSHNKNAFPINKALYTAFEERVQSIADIQLKAELNELLDCLKFQIVRNSVWSDYCHRRNPAKYKHRKEAYSACKCFISNNAEKQLHDHDKYLLSIFQYPFFVMDIMIKSRVIRGAGYFAYKLLKKVMS